MATKKQKTLLAEDNTPRTDSEFTAVEASTLPDSGEQPTESALYQTGPETETQPATIPAEETLSALNSEERPNEAALYQTELKTETQPAATPAEETLLALNSGEQPNEAALYQTEPESVSGFEAQPDAAFQPPVNAGGQTVGQTETERTKNPRWSRKADENQTLFGTRGDSQSMGAAAVKDSLKRRVSIKTETVMPIDARRTVETDADRTKNDLLDLFESLKTGRILTGTVQGVERAPDNQSVAVIYHGAFKVVIPAEGAVDPPADYRGQSPTDVLHYMLTKRLGAEVDYIVKGIDHDGGVAVANRLDAMRAKRKQYYFGVGREGNNLLYAGVCAESRVVSVIRTGIFVDLFGLEVYIPLKELSYQRMMDATGVFQPGQRILVKVLDVDRSDRNHIKVSASVKQAAENPYEKALRRYTVGNRYVGTVSMVNTNGVFVALDGGVDCLCSYPKRGRPPRAARVTVRILGINRENNRIWGAITHIAMPN
jgi:predicted RNA-binding protein with RPS1 domain